MKANIDHGFEIMNTESGRVLNYKDFDRRDLFTLFQYRSWKVGDLHIVAISNGTGDDPNLIIVEISEELFSYFEKKLKREKLDLD